MSKRCRKVKIEFEYPSECCPKPCGTTGYGMGYSGVQGGEAWGIRWIYALLVLIVIILQFGRNQCPCNVPVNSPCGEDKAVSGGGFLRDNQSIDNSVLFIIVVFLLVLCAGCWWGGQGAGSYSGGYGNY